MKAFYIYLTMVFVLGALAFWREIAALFTGMPPLEILKQIASFALHVAWITILGFLATTLPKMVKPWLRTFRWKQRQMRRQRFSGSAGQRAKLPRINKDAMLMTFIEREMHRQRNGRER